MEQFHCWWKAPTGYLNGARGEPSLIPDPERGQFITQLFDLLATGEWGKADAMARVTALGLRSRKGVPLTQETLRKVMTNPIYKGEIFVKVWGKSVRGDFVPLVTAATFDRVQAILDGRAPAHIAHVTDRDEFPLRGLLLCPKCQKTITASFSTGHLGKKFGNYRCHHGKNHINVSAGLVEAAFIALLERLTPKPERMRIIEKIFRERWGELVQASTTESLKLKQELGKLEARKERALVQVADGC